MDYYNNPLRKLERIGNWDRNHGFRETDRRLLTSPRATQKIEDRWRKSPQIFDIYLVNTPKSNKSEYREVGPVDPEWLNEAFNTDLEFAEDAISIVFTNNMGVESVPLTGWVMAHRFAHALRYYKPHEMDPDWERIIRLIDTHLDKIITTYGMDRRYPYLASQYGYRAGGMYSNYKTFQAYERCRKSLAEQLGTSRAARTGNLRNVYEWNYELVAQFITTGRIHFKELGDCVDFGPQPFGRRTEKCLSDIPMTYQLNNYGRRLASDLQGGISTLLESAVGRVFLM